MLLHRRLVVVLVAAASLFGAPRAGANPSFAIADRDAATIRGLVGSLAADTDDLSGEFDRGVVTLARTMLYEFDRFDASRTENRIHLVRRDTTAPARSVLPVDSRFVERARGWILRADGRFERTPELGGPDADAALEDDRPLALEFGDLGPGDAFGWTVTSALPFGVEHRAEHLSQRWPTLRTRIHVRSARHLSYRVEAVHCDDLPVAVEVRERRDGHPSWYQVDAGPIPAHREAVFAPHPVVHEPFVRVVRRGRFYRELGSWVLQNDWDVWAALEMGSPRVWLDDGVETRRLASELTARGGTEIDRADALYAWVVQNIRLERSPFPASVFEDADRTLNLDPLGLEDALELNEGPSSFYGWRPPFEWETNEVTGDPHMGRYDRPATVRPVDEVIASGQGNGLERAAVLASLIRAAGLDALIGFARDDRLGPVDVEATGRWQFTHALVTLLGADRIAQRWYCPSREDLPAGRLGRGLRRVPVLFVDPTIDEQMRSLWNTVWRAEGRVPERVIPRYLAAMGRETWTRTLRTPAGETLPVQTLVEVLRFGPRAVAAAADVRMAPAFDPHAYWARRFPSAADSTTPLATTLALDARHPTGGAPWEIDPSSVYGHGPLHEWTSPRRLPVTFDRTREYRWSVSLPLPANWKGVAPVDPVSFDHDAVHYRAWMVGGKAAVVLERQLVLRAGTVEGDDLHDLDAIVASILAFEDSPIVLRSTADSP